MSNYVVKFNKIIIVKYKHYKKHSNLSVKIFFACVYILY